MVVMVTSARRASCFGEETRGWEEGEGKMANEWARRYTHSTGMHTYSDVHVRMADTCTHCTHNAR